MSRRANRTRRVTEAKVTRELAELDAHTRANMLRLVDAYHEKHVAPLKAWAELPWYRRIFSRP